MDDNDQNKLLFDENFEIEDDDIPCSSDESFSEMHCLKGANDGSTSIFDMPQLIIDKIFSQLSYEELSRLRTVSADFNEYAKNELNKGFEKLGKIIETCKSDVKKELPKRESLRRRHRLTKINEIYMALDTRYSLLDLTFKKYMRHSHPLLNMCFIPGKVLDEFHKVLNIVQNCRDCGGEFTDDSSELLKELRDLSSMAMEHYEENILPSLEELANKEGIVPYMFNNMDTPPRKRRNTAFRRGPNIGGFSMPRLEFLMAASSGARDPNKTMQDKIDAQQKQIDSQQADIRMLRDALHSTFDFLSTALPNHRNEMRRMLSHIPMFSETDNALNEGPSTLECRKRRHDEEDLETRHGKKMKDT